MDVLKDLVVRDEKGIDKLKCELSKRRGLERPLQVVAFHGHGTHEAVEIRGRLLVDRGIKAAADDDSILDNIVRMYKRLESDELPGVNVNVSFGGQATQTVSDEEGYFHAAISPTRPLDGHMLWHKVTSEVGGKTPLEGAANGWVQVPRVDSVFGIISDIDDTIIETGAASLRRLIGNTFLNNAKTRLPFAGVREFYTALQRGTADEAANPLFYVSNGPWNLFDFLDDFMALNGIPRGAIFLRDYGFDADKFIKDDRHKLEAITALLETYAPLPFVLIGDSGEKDPEIYQQVVRTFPGRILAVYIRDVTAAPRDIEVNQIAKEVLSAGIDMIVVQDTAAAAEHAAGIGLIDRHAVAAVKQTINQG